MRVARIARIRATFKTRHDEAPFMPGFIPVSFSLYSRQAGGDAIRQPLSFARDANILMHFA